MSINRYQDYLIVLFEDRAYKDIFSGFEISSNKQVFQKPVLGGFKKIHLELTDIQNSLLLKELNKFHNAYVLVCLDADLDSQSESKIEQLKNDITEEYKNRIFILGSKYEAEQIKSTIITQGKWERVGRELDNSCKNGNYELWYNDMLNHNINEISRLKKVLDKIL